MDKKYFAQNKSVHVMSHTQIAEELGVTKQYVQQIEKKAIEKFKRRFKNIYPDTPPLIAADVRSGRW